MTGMNTLWHVRIDEDDWGYDRFAEAVVWAETPERAEEIIRSAIWHDDKLWIENPDWRLHVQPANSDGVALVHWRAG